MINLDDWTTIKTIKGRNPDYGSRKIAELLGISRNTVKRALKSETPPEYIREEKTNPLLVPFEEYIKKSSITDKLTGSRILEEIISKGYNGSKSSYYRYLAKVTVKEVRTYHPYETAPGEQSQFDWSPYTMLIDGQRTIIYVFIYILGFSRFRIYEASLGVNQSSVLEAIEISLQSIGGVTDRIQTDNAKCFVKNPSRDNFQWNPRYLSFCGHYGIKPSRSLPKRPWSKGKVENPFDYLEDHLIQGRQFGSFDDFLKELKLFEYKVNNRIHGTTKKTPAELFNQERASLIALPPNRYVGIYEESRKVSTDCLISFNGNRYSVPYLFATKHVWLKISRGHILEIYSQQNNLVAKHPLCLQKGKVIMISEHYKNHRVEKGNMKRVELTFNDIFPADNWFMEKLKTQKKINPQYHLTQILELVKYYPLEEIRKTFNTCKTYNTYSYVFIRGNLEKYSSIKEDSLQFVSIHKEIFIKQDIKRPLSHYKMNQEEQQ